jgi:hypothetical protein
MAEHAKHLTAGYQALVLGARSCGPGKLFGANGGHLASAAGVAKADMNYNMYPQPTKCGDLIVADQYAAFFAARNER